MFTFGIFVGFFIAWILSLSVSDRLKSMSYYKVISTNKKTTVLEEQSVRQKHFLIQTSNFAGRPIRPGDVVSFSQFPQTPRFLNLDFMPLLKKGEEKEILKSHGINID